MNDAVLPGLIASISSSRRWLGETRQIDHSHPKLRITALKLTQSVHGRPERARAIAGFVRTLAFRAEADTDFVRASDALRRARGDCHSKGSLFVALCRAAGIPARLQFVEVRARFMHGVLPGLETIFHALGQVQLESGAWSATDVYVIDPPLHDEAIRRLEASGRDCGWGVWRDGAFDWNGRSNVAQQFDPSTDLIKSLGPYDDPATFYQDAARRRGRSEPWIARLKYAAAAQVVNRRVAAMRASARRRHGAEASLPPATGSLIG